MELYSIFSEINNQLEKNNRVAVNGWLSTFRRTIKQYLEDYRFPEDKVIDLVICELKKIENKHPELVYLVYKELIDLLCFHTASMVKALFRHELLQEQTL